MVQCIYIKVSLSKHTLHCDVCEFLFLFACVLCLSDHLLCVCACVCYSVEVCAKARSQA